MVSQEKLRLSFGIFFTFLGVLTTPIHADEDVTEGCKPVQTVSDFDIDVYASAPWYIHQQAVTKYSPLEENYCVTAHYEVLEKATWWKYTVKVNNEAKNENGGKSGGELCAYQTGDEGEDLSKLEVAPCWLPKSFAGPYWVVAYDETEGYALVSGGQPNILADPDDPEQGCRTKTGTNDSGLWIFSRSQERDEDLILKVRTIAQEAGFDLSVLNDVDHTDCDVCEDEDESFNIWWAGNVDCEWVKNRKNWLVCAYAKDECPKTCDKCD